jgi:CubicO group peptidase (beta-lactamase class C family)
MRSISYLLMLFSLCLTAFGAAQASQADIQKFVAAEAAAAGVPGVSYAWIEGDKTTFGHYGVTAKTDGKPVSESTAFVVGSISKSFTAVAIMQLKERGLLNLDDAVSLHLPEFDDTSAGAITIRQLLSHTSGYSTLQGNGNQTDFTIDINALERRVAALRYVGPIDAPGEGWSYSNVNYQLLSRIVEVIVDQEFGEYVESAIMKPLGMRDSRMIDWETGNDDAAGHRPWFWTKMQYDGRGAGRGSLGQGGVMSSARDMAKYLTMMMNGQDDILTAISKKEMMQAASTVSPDYGLGWFLAPDQGLVFHSGANPGFEALATMRPNAKKAFVILTNGGSGFGFGATEYLRFGATTIALDEAEETPPDFTLKGVFLFLCALPLLFLFSALRFWKKRKPISMKGRLGRFFYIWAPLILATILSYVLLILIPSSFGVDLKTATLFQPDTGLLLVISSIAVLIWAIVRGVAARKSLV